MTRAVAGAPPAAAAAPAAPPALALVLALAAAACAREHRVQIEIVAGDGTLGLGFRCVDAGGTPLAARALVGNRLEFRIILDLIGVGDTVPGCRGEEILRACPRAEDCPTLVVSADGRRACAQVTVEPPLDQASIVRQVQGALRGLEITPDAPDRPVIVRAVATTERCDDRLAAPQGDTYAALDPAAAIGCAYSCPLQLDTIDGAVALYLDALDERCEAQVRACAGFPD